VPVGNMDSYGLGAVTDEDPAHSIQFRINHAIYAARWWPCSTGWRHCLSMNGKTIITLIFYW